MLTSVVLQVDTRSLGPSLTLLFFLLVPGYISLKMYLRARYREDDFETFDKWLYSAMFGVVSLFGLALLYRLNPLAPILAWTSPSGELQWGISVFRERELMLNELTDTSVLEFILAISTQTAIGSFTAHKAGKYFAERSDDTRSEYDLKQPWETALEGVDRGDLLRVITCGGREIEGQLHQSGSTEGNYDILLRKPIEVTYENEERTERPLYGDQTTDVMYFRHRDISHVQFVSYQLPDVEIEDLEDEFNDSELDEEETDQSDEYDEPVDLEIEEDNLSQNEDEEREDKTDAFSETEEQE